MKCLSLISVIECYKSELNSFYLLGDLTVFDNKTFPCNHIQGESKIKLKHINKI